MERNGNRIINTQAEQELIGVPAELSINGAINEAAIQKSRARGLYDQADDYIDSSDKDWTHKQREMRMLATQCLMYSAGVTRLCEPELSERRRRIGVRD